MKAKKKLLIGTAIAALAAGGASAVSTMAWYGATAARGVNPVAATKADLATEASSTSIGALDVKVTMAVATGYEHVVLTTKDGYTLGVANNKLVDAAVSGDQKLYGKVDLTINAYKPGTETAADATDLIQLKAGTYDIKFTAGARTRISKTEPAGNSQSQFASVFGEVDFGNNFTLTLTVTAGQTTLANAMSLSQSSIFYAVGGDSSNGNYSSYTIGTSASAEASASISGSITSGPNS